MLAAGAKSLTEHKLCLDQNMRLTLRTHITGMGRRQGLRATLDDMHKLPGWAVEGIAAPGE